MRRSWPIRPLFFAAWLGCLAWSTRAGAQELTLTQDSEESFRRFIHMAQSGTLGDDVRNANVALEGAQARVELVRDAAPGKLLVLTPKRSQQTVSRYFDIAPGENATPEDVRLVGRALDACFGEDPFQFAGLEESLAGGPMPGIGEAWTYGGWQGVLRVFERRMMALASLEYTVAISIALAVGFFASLIVVWGTSPATGGGRFSPKIGRED